MNILIKLGLVITLIGTSWSERCENPRVRKEIRELSQRELSDFVTALSILHAQPKNDTSEVSKYEAYAELHSDNKQYAHFRAEFLPWHRIFLRDLEKELQAINPNIMLPYWDWSLDSVEPHKSPVLSRQYFGGNGLKSQDNCLRSGPFSNWEMSYPTPHCLKRDFDEGDQVSAFSSPESIVLDLEENRFSDFSYQVEIKHGSPHVNIGGFKGDLFPMYSPNDPIFFLHHTFMDLLFSEWQKRHPGVAYEGKRYPRGSASEDDILKPYNKTVKSTFDTLDEEYCYTYPEYPRPIVTQRTSSETKSFASSAFQLSSFSKKRHSIDRKKLFSRSSIISRFFNSRNKLRFKKPLPASFLKLNGIGIAEVRKEERKEALLIRFLNNQANFTSLAFVQSLITQDEEKSPLPKIDVGHPFRF